MPEIRNVRHSDEMQDIITKVPSWLLRWGITLIFSVLALFFCVSAFIHYPDIVKSQLKIVSINGPEPVMAKVPGKLVQLLVSDHSEVRAGQLLAFIGSTGNHGQVISLLKNITFLQQQLSENKSFDNSFILAESRAQLGELLGSYQNFYQAYLVYRTSVGHYSYMGKRAYQQDELINVNFLQAANRLSADIHDWLNKYVLTAPRSGRISYADILRENEFIKPNQTVFYVEPSIYLRADYFGELAIPEYYIGKVKLGHKVLVKLKNYPFEEYGILEGRISYITEMPDNHGFLIAKVNFCNNESSKKLEFVHLQQGMLGSAEIITQDVTLFRRITHNLTKAITLK